MSDEHLDKSRGRWSAMAMPTRTRALPPERERVAGSACWNCGYDPMGSRRKCPACHRPAEAGGMGDDADL